MIWRHLIALILFLISSVWVSGDNGPNHRARQTRPIRLGTSGGNNTDFTQQFCCSGTLGALVKDGSGRKYVLSNNHVLAKSNKGIIGQDIGQPGLIDVNCSISRAEPVAQLSRYLRIAFDHPNRVDAAIAEVIQGKVTATGAILDIGQPGSPVEPAIGMLVKKSGRTTGKTVGQVIAIHVTVRVEIPSKCGDNNGKVARFADQFVVDKTTTRRFSDSGDSGSLIVTRRASCPNSVGLLFGGDDTGLAVANRILAVLSRLNVTIVGCGNAASSSIAIQGTSLDPSIERLERIRER